MIHRTIKKVVFIIPTRPFRFEWPERLCTPAILELGDTFCFTITVNSSGPEDKEQEILEKLDKRFEELLAEFHKRLPPDQQVGTWILDQFPTQEESRARILETFPCECGAAKLGIPGHSHWCPQVSLGDNHWALKG